ncbi:MAG: hypothetical protein ACK5TE_03410 [Pseudomonadota bacterium]
MHALKTAAEKALLFLADIIVRAAFLAYRTAAFIVALGKAGVILALVVAVLASAPVAIAWLLSRIPGFEGLAPPAWLLPLAPLTLLAALVWLLAPARAPDRAAPRAYPGLLGRIDSRIDRLIAWVGRLKFFRNPLVFVVDPGGYRVAGSEVRALLGIVQPGDILLRGYDGYVDGLFIGLTGGSDTLSRRFSHAALYVGDLGDEHHAIAARRLQSPDGHGGLDLAAPAQIDAVRNDPAFFERGPNRVIHAMTQGVFTEDLLTFARCDYLAVLRIGPARIALQPSDRTRARATQLIADTALRHSEQWPIHQRLMNGDSLARSEAIEAAVRSALGKIGSGYDFQFNEGHTASRFSCSEFVYYCYKGLHTFLGLEPRPHSLMGLFRRVTVSPGDLWQAAGPGGRLEVVWVSRSLPVQPR